MKTSLWTIGTTKSRLYAEIIEDYNTRLRHYLKYDYREIPVDGRGGSQVVKKRESDKILASLKPRDNLYLWDVQGRQLGSREFAAFMEDRMHEGTDITFLIGGAYGFHRDVIERANGRFSLSKMTFNHQLVRIIILEQLYRAMTIIRNEPYHNG